MENIRIDVKDFLDQFPIRKTKVGIYLPGNFPNKPYNLYIYTFLRYCAQPIQDTLETYLIVSTFNQIKDYLIQSEVCDEEQFNSTLTVCMELGLISSATAKELEAEEDGYAFNYLPKKRFVKIEQKALQNLLTFTVKHQLAFSLLCIFQIDWDTYLYYGNVENHSFYTYKTLLDKMGWPTEINQKPRQLLANALNFIFTFGFATPVFSQQRFSRKQSPFQVMRITEFDLTHHLTPSLNLGPQIAQLLKLTDCEDNTNV